LRDLAACITIGPIILNRWEALVQASMLTPVREVRLRALCGALLMAVASVAQATLVRTDSSAFVDLAVIGGPCPPGPACEAQDEQPVLASVQLGSTFTTADVSLGLIRAYTDASAGSGGESAGAGTGAEILFTLTNQGSTPVVLPAGALTFNVRASFARTLGSLSGTTVAAALAYGSNPGNTASADIQYFFFDSAVPGTVTLNQNTSGGTSIIVNTATSSVLDLSLFSGTVTVMPGEDLSMSFLFQPAASAIGVGGTAVIDASQTAMLGLVLPAGTGYDSNGLATPWISVVPEVPSAVLLSLGLLSLAARRRA
jgi:hypothetical protein